MTTRLVVIDVVGLTPGLLGDGTPNLSRLAREGFQANLEAVLPAVTCTAQSTILTGRLPREHGIVGNGWFFRDLSEIWLWRQSNRLVQAEKVWERARRRRPGLTCAKLFWWYNMYSTADIAVTPRPVYHADGRKTPSVYTEPPGLRTTLERELGTFPLFQFWGPGADLRSSDWIAACARRVLRDHGPDLTLVYLPHLDYDLQRFGPAHDRARQAVRDVDRAAGSIIDVARELDMDVMVLSEYGITPVEGSVSLNRVLRENRWLRVHETIAGELLDAGASRAFALCDHQIAHVYVRDAVDIPEVKRLLESTEGVDAVLDRAAQAEIGLDHRRSGELVAISKPRSWFDYYYWLDDERAPDFARTVDIHRKPGYDPAELFLDPHRALMHWRVLAKLLLRKAGFRTLLDVIPLDSNVVRGSHGRLPDRAEDGPVLLCSRRDLATSRLGMTAVADLMERILVP